MICPAIVSIGCPATNSSSFYDAVVERKAGRGASGVQRAVAFARRGALALGIPRLAKGPSSSLLFSGQGSELRFQGFPVSCYGRGQDHLLVAVHERGSSREDVGRLSYDLTGHSRIQQDIRK